MSDPIKCDFPACAVHHICTNPCERNQAEQASCEHEWRVTKQGVTYMDSHCVKCGKTERESWD